MIQSHFADVEPRGSIISGSRFVDKKEEDRRSGKKQNVPQEQRITCARKMPRRQVSKTGTEQQADQRPGRPAVRYRNEAIIAAAEANTDTNGDAEVNER